MRATKVVSAVTGASSGLGRAVALRLGGEGGTILLIARHPERLAAVAREVGERGGTAMVSHVDVRDLTSLRRVFRMFNEDDIRLGELIHCAGILYPGDHGRAMEAKATEMQAVNTQGTYNVLMASKAALSRSGGRVAVVSSIAARLVLPPGISAYAESKRLQATLAEARRWELDTAGVRLTVAYPGIIDTPMVRGQEAELPSWYRAFPWAPAEVVASQILADMRVGERESYYPRWHRQGVHYAARYPRLWRVALRLATLRTG